MHRINRAIAWSLAFLFLALNTASLSADAETGDTTVGSYVVHPDATHYASANWYGYPNSTLWSLLASNDGASSYIYAATGWDLAYFKMHDFSALGVEGEYYILTFWAIIKIATPLPPNALECIITMAKGMSWYETSEIRYTHIFSVKDQWVNISIMSGQCPWTASNWTVSDINSVLYGIAKNGNPGTIYSTEMGVRIDVYAPSESAAPDYNRLGIILIMMALISGILLFVIMREVLR